MLLLVEILKLGHDKTVNLATCLHVKCNATNLNKAKVNE